MFEEEENSYFFNNNYLDEYSFDTNKHFTQEIEFKIDLEDKNYTNDEIYSNNSDEKYNENQRYFNENKKKNLTEFKSDAKTGASTLSNVKEKEGLIFKITKEMKKNIGRKRKSSGGKHNKFCYDNVTRKLKTKLFESILNFLNASLEKVEVENTRKYSKKKIYSKPIFLKINQDIIKDINVDNNNKLLKSTLKEIY